MHTALDPNWLAAQVERLRPAAASGRLLVACSGGMDSVVLLDACVAAGLNLHSAVYVDHGLHAESARWGDCAARACQRAGVSLRRLTVDPGRGGNLEARARAARYAALAETLAPGDILLTAHHADDQLETVLLQLLRGAGPAGLAAMPDVRPLGVGWHMRPLLAMPQAALREYAAARRVVYADDPSNLDCRFERNFLRRDIVPLLRARWPGVLATVARSARLCAESQALGADLAALDGVDRDGDGPLSLVPLAELPARRVNNAVRAWLRRQDVRPPNQARLDEFVRQLRDARGDRQPELRWGSHVLRRYRDWLYLLPPDAPPPAGWSAALGWGETLALPAGLGELSLCAEPSSVAASHAVAVTFRRGGEALALTAGGRHVTVKSLFQSHGVLPWRRGSVPLLWSEGRLVAVGDLWHDPAWCDPQSGRPAAVVWRERPVLRAPAAAATPRSKPSH